LLDEIYDDDYDTIGWVVMELMRWGCDINYQEPYFHSNIENDLIIKVDNKYYGYSGENFKIKIRKDV
jgi:hypothetical protein